MRRGVSVVCASCGRSYIKQSVQGWQGRCARCAKKVMRPYTADDFWSLVLRPEEGCWPWTGQRNSQGYGQIGYQKAIWRTHRLAYVLTHGPIPTRTVVRHLCANILCCRPDHLQAGTQKDNADDRARDGHTATGTRHGKHTRPDSSPRGDAHWTHRYPERIKKGQPRRRTLSDEQIAEITEQYHHAGTTLAALAQRFGVSITTVWRHIKTSEGIKVPHIARQTDTPSETSVTDA